MTLPGPAFQECREYSRPKGSIIQSAIGCIDQDRDSRYLGTLYQPSYNFTHTMTPSDPLLFADTSLDT